MCVEGNEQFNLYQRLHENKTKNKETRPQISDFIQKETQHNATQITIITDKLCNYFQLLKKKKQ